MPHFTVLCFKYSKNKTYNNNNNNNLYLSRITRLAVVSFHRDPAYIHSLGFISVQLYNLLFFKVSFTIRLDQFWRRQ